MIIVKLGTSLDFTLNTFSNQNITYCQVYIPKLYNVTARFKSVRCHDDGSSCIHWAVLYG